MSDNNYDVISSGVISGKLSLFPWRSSISQTILPPPFCPNQDCSRTSSLSVESHNDVVWLCETGVIWWILLAFLIILTGGFITLIRYYLKIRYCRNLERRKLRQLSGSHIIFFSPMDDEQSSCK